MTSTSSVQKSKQKLLIEESCDPSWKWQEVKERQLRNMFAPTSLTDCGMVIVVIGALEKAFSPMNRSCEPSWNVMELQATQPEKACTPMLLTEAGMSTEVRAVQKKNAQSPMVVRLEALEKSTSVRAA